VLESGKNVEVLSVSGAEAKKVKTP
jgi:hypothetical protein